MNVDQISGPVFSKPVTFLIVNEVDQFLSAALDDDTLTLTIFGTEF